MNTPIRDAASGNPAMPFVSVVMPAHNEEQYIGDCLQSLNRQTYPADRFEIIVVDNNSTDRTAEIAKASGATVLFKEKGPVGAVRNFGAMNAKGDIIAFIDSDCVAPSSWLAHGSALIAANPDTAYGGGCYLRDNPFFIEKFWLLSNNNEGTLPKHLIGASFFIHKSLFQKAGMFDEHITSGEDTKLSESIESIGKKVAFSDSLSVAHLGNPITSRTFFKRQIWHAENYLKNFGSARKDPVFYLVALFLLLLVVALINYNDPKIFITAITIALFVPGIFSVKRIVRSKYKLKSLSEFFFIYYLDLLYVSGRGVGLLKSVARKAKELLF